MCEWQKVWDDLAVSGVHPRMAGLAATVGQDVGQPGQSASAAARTPAPYGQQGLQHARPGAGWMEWIYRPVHGGPPGYVFRVGDLTGQEVGEVAD